MTSTNRFRNLLTALLVAASLAACGGGGDGTAAEPGAAAPPVTASAGAVTLETSGFTASTLSASTVGPAGGVLTVTGAGDSLAGASIAVPAGALVEPVTVSLVSAAVASATGLPTGAAPRGRAIRVQMTSVASGAAVGSLRKLVRLTLPYDAATTDAVGYYQLENGGSLEAMGFDRIDRAAHAITFATRAPSLTGTVAAASAAASASKDGRRRADAVASPFATYVAIGLAQDRLAAFASTQAVVDSGFRPSVNGFSMPNYGSSYRTSVGGNCFGMIGFAKYYYQMGFAAPLADTYRDAQKTATWIDDAVAIELASREQNLMSDIWPTYVQELDLEAVSSSDVAYSLLGALYITGKPALVALWRVVDGDLTDGHAASVWRATVHADGSIAFATYDPNFEKDDARQITWSRAGGFDNYVSGETSAAADNSYNGFKQVSMALGLTPEQLARDKADADAGYPASVFPVFTITAIRGVTLGDDALASTGTSPDGVVTFKTADTAVVIEGTVLGGNAQLDGSVASVLNVFGPDGSQSESIDNDVGSGSGRFSVVVPVRPGLNPIALLASDLEVVTHWSAFRQVIVESNATPSRLTTTLTWDRGTSDVDLYVKEPDGAAGTLFAGQPGDIVFWAHRAGVSATNAYLDFDNTDGFGPEHYIVAPGLTTRFANGDAAPSAIGTYTVGVHYFGWSGAEDAADRSIGWTVKWRYLKSCNNGCADPERDGLWVSGSQNGRLAHDDEGQAGPDGFRAGGSAWSPKFQFSMPNATTSWTVPPSNTVMLP